MYEVKCDNKKERILTVGVDLNKKDGFDFESSMNELSKLVEAAEGEVIGSITQKRESIDTAYYIGKGKVQEISVYCSELDIDTVIFNNELTGAQIRNLEDVIKRKIVDRTNLILDIFARRALSKEGKLQVELAQLKYRLPRLIGFGNELSRAGAGIGTRGPGEKKLETDRRHILERVYEIERQMKEIENVRVVKRKKRQMSDTPIVALIGYTNAGKSTLLNRLIKLDTEYSEDKEVLAQDMLFATLDTTLRKSVLPNGKRFLISDTVGFVSKLPTKLIEAFKGTLEEVKYADLLLHVVDITNKDYNLQINTTLDILKELDVLNKPIITVFNKVDEFEEEIIFDLPKPNVFISAKDNYNISLLLEEIQNNLPQKYHYVKVLIPYSEGSIISNIFNNTKVESSEYVEEGVLLNTVLNSIELEKYKKYLVD